MPLFEPTPVLVQPYFGWRSTDRLTVSGRALRRRRAATFEKTGRVRAMRTMIEQFASREVAGLEVRLELKGPGGTVAEHRTVSDSEGYVRFDVALNPHWPLGSDPAWEIALLHWITPDGPQCAEAWVLAPGTVTKLAVISDIDDTIVETGITGGPRAVLRNWRRVVAELPAERIAVPGADGFYGELGGGAVAVAPERAGGDRAGAHFAATHRPFFYVSSSPWNLFRYLVAFIQSRNLPLGPLLLRDWGLNRATFGSGSHGEHKRAAIEGLLAFYPEMRFALIGDDTQGDLPAYADAVRHFPGRVAAVFIRTGSGPLSPDELAGKAAIEAAGVPLWLGDDFATGADFLRANGISTAGETAQIVKAVQAKQPRA